MNSNTTSHIILPFLYPLLPILQLTNILSSPFYISHISHSMMTLILPFPSFHQPSHISNLDYHTINQWISSLYLLLVSHLDVILINQLTLFHVVLKHSILVIDLIKVWTLPASLLYIEFGFSATNSYPRHIYTSTSFPTHFTTPFYHC